MITPSYDGLRLYYGDIHNHCGVSYGHGSPEDAFANARQQLDFASVVAHAHWPDMPVGDPALAALVAYHQEGFRKAERNWPHLQELTQAVHEDGRFVTFLAFEWHSLRYGDHVVYYNGSRGDILRVATLPEMRQRLRGLAAQGMECFAIPHHIGYLTGRRGISWGDFSPEFSPVVEMVSMHGLAESDEGPYAYLHTMGPRDGRSTMQHGLRLGQVFGVIGSSDHHSGHPGSYGHGLLAAWAGDLTRRGIWDAIAARRTYALTGDRIALAVALNGSPMGSVVPAARERRIEVAVVGGAGLDAVDILHNNQVVHRWSGPPAGRVQPGEAVKVHVEVGWGDRSRNQDWQVELAVEGGRLLAVEPRFRGHPVVSPQGKEEASYALSAWERLGEAAVRFRTRTWGNVTTVTPSTQGVCLEIAGEPGTRLRGRFNGSAEDATLGELLEGARAGYLGGFRTPAYVFGRAVPAGEYTCQTSFTHEGKSQGCDWYYVRVSQRNGQLAWSSPIFVKAG